VIAAWLLTGGVYRSEYMHGDPNREWLIEAVKTNANAFQQQLAGIEDADTVLAQLRRVDHLSVRKAYRKVQASQRGGLRCVRTCGARNEPATP
jgi:hypothetical protein